MVLRRQTDTAEGDAAEFADGNRPAGGNDVVIGRILLKHKPDRVHIILGMAPISLRVEIPEGKLFGQAELDPSNTVSHLASNEFKAPQWGLMVEQNAACGVQTEALAIIHGHPM